MFLFLILPSCYCGCGYFLPTCPLPSVLPHSLLTQLCLLPYPYHACACGCMVVHSHIFTAYYFPAYYLPSSTQIHTLYYLPLQHYLRSLSRMTDSFVHFFWFSLCSSQAFVPGSSSGYTHFFRQFSHTPHTSSPCFLNHAMLLPACQPCQIPITLRNKNSSTCALGLSQQAGMPMCRFVGVIGQSQCTGKETVWTEPPTDLHFPTRHYPPSL